MKKKLLTTLSVVLILGLAALGILAYLTDTDSDVNVMTLGNVDIEQNEVFEQGADLYPGVDVTKEVSVTNVGDSAAYVRTLVAFETIDVDGFKYVPKWKDGLERTKITTIEVDGVKYDVYEVVYDNAVAPGTETAKSLMSVKLHEDCTNEHMTALGGTYEVLVLSQAVQADGFANAQTALEAAFPKGDDNENVVGWFGGMAIPNVFTADELKAALSENGEIILGDDIDMGSTKITVPSGVTATLDLNGHSITSTASQTIVNKGNLTVKGDGSVSGKIAIFNQTGTLTVLGGTYQGTQYGVGAMLDTCTVNGDFSDSSFYGCTMTGGNYENCRIESFTILGGTYTDCEFVNTGTYQAGTFDFQPDANWTNGGKITDNGDGTWTVTQ